jgi:hypothetical protein
MNIPSGVTVLAAIVSCRVAKIVSSCVSSVEWKWPRRGSSGSEAGN